MKALKSNNISVGERVHAATYISGKQITDTKEGKKTKHCNEFHFCEIAYVEIKHMIRI